MLIVTHRHKRGHAKRREETKQRFPKQEKIDEQIQLLLQTTYGNAPIRFSRRLRFVPPPGAFVARLIITINTFITFSYDG